MDSIYKSKGRVRSKNLVRKQTNSNNINLYENEDPLNGNQSHSRYNTNDFHSSSNFNEIKTGKNGEESVFIGENFRPNELLLANTNFATNIGGKTKMVSRMTENSYTSCDDPTSQYKRMMILEMANSVISESNTLFGNQREKEYRPYEEQTEFQVSLAQNKRTQQIAHSITSKYISNNNT